MKEQEENVGGYFYNHGMRRTSLIWHQKHSLKDCSALVDTDSFRKWLLQFTLLLVMYRIPVAVCSFQQLVL